MTVATCEKVPPAPVFRSILNPDSLFALSVQLRLIWLPDAVVAARPEGAEGGVGGGGGYKRVCGITALGVEGLDQERRATASPPLSKYSMLMLYCWPAVSAMVPLNSVGAWPVQSLTS